MKKLFGILLSVVLVFSFMACNKELSQTNYISAVEGTEREKAILTMTSNHFNLFNFKQDREYKEVSLWIEKYESGKLVDEKITHIITPVEESGSIILATSTTGDKKELQEFHIGISSQEGSDSISSYDPDSAGLDQMTGILDHLQKGSIPTDGKAVLTASCYSTDNDGMSSFTDDFYMRNDEAINELEQCDFAYLLKAEFIK